jgi:hypothetical protein
MFLQVALYNLSSKYTVFVIHNVQHQLITAGLFKF